MLGNAPRKESLGDAEGLGRLNIAAASAAPTDRGHVREVRTVVASEGQQGNSFLDSLKLPHTDSQTNFVFFNTGSSGQELAAQFRARGIEIGRTFPPYTTWARITIGLPAENKIVQERLSEAVSTS
jgi:histidinol-phosphate aminotransferase